MVTAVCVSIDPLAGTLSYSSAGHPPPLLLDATTGALTRLESASAPPLGVAEPPDIIEAEVALPGHVRLALYSDGLVERRGESIDHGIEVLGVTIAHQSDLDAGEALAAMTREIGAPSDDMALLVAAVEPAAAFSIELPARPDSLAPIRRRLRAWLARAGFDLDAAAEVVLAVSEACSNAIEHAYDASGPGTVLLRAQAGEGGLHLEVVDRGRWLVSEPNDERGRGLYLMRGLMDRVEVETDGEGTRIVLERGRRDAASSRVAPVAQASGA
jgi:anti-sigma regulatory factor (Ser/Thr protein kinase)